MEVSSNPQGNDPPTEAEIQDRWIWPVRGFFGYNGPLYRHLTHIVSCWFFGMPAYLFMRLAWRIKLEGKPVLYTLKPPFLMVSNHQSLIDSHVVCLAFGLWPRGLLDPHIAPFHTPDRRIFMKGPLSWLLHMSLRCVPFQRQAGLLQRGMDTIIELLQGRNVVYMFPEGTRSRDGHIGSARAGVGRAVLESGCAVLPIHISGLNKVLPIGARLPRLGGQIRIVVGDVIPSSRFQDATNDREGWLTVSEQLLDAVRSLEKGRAVPAEPPRPPQQQPRLPEQGAAAPEAEAEPGRLAQ